MGHGNGQWPVASMNENANCVTNYNDTDAKRIASNAIFLTTARIPVQPVPWKLPEVRCHVLQKESIHGCSLIEVLLFSSTAVINKFNKHFIKIRTLCVSADLCYS